LRELDTPLLVALEADHVVCADLYEFDVGATTYRFTSCDRDLTGIAPADVETYTAINIDRERIRTSDGLEVDDFEIAISHDSTAVIGGKTWVNASLDGDLDEAPVRVYRAYLRTSDWSVIGCYLRFQGVVSTPDPGSTTLRIVAVVSTDNFARAFPTLTYEMWCIWSLGGPGCDTAVTLDYTTAGNSHSTSGFLYIDALPGGVAAKEWFVGGVVTFNGHSRTILTVASDALGYKFVVSPAFLETLAGATPVTIRRGCTKSAASCHIYFDNLTHHLGAPYAPVRA
jgi:hypothetical protein